MTQINLLKRRKMTVDEFKTWLNQLITDKKGALPDLNDWKKIKETLDKVKSTQYTPFDLDMSGIVTTYNGQELNLLEANKYETKKSEDKLNGDCNGK